MSEKVAAKPEKAPERTSQPCDSMSRSKRNRQTEFRMSANDLNKLVETAAVKRENPFNGFLLRAITQSGYYCAKRHKKTSSDFHGLNFGCFPEHVLKAHAPASFSGVLFSCSVQFFCFDVFRRRSRLRPLPCAARETSFRPARACSRTSRYRARRRCCDRVRGPSR